MIVQWQAARAAARMVAGCRRRCHRRPGVLGGAPASPPEEPAGRGKSTITRNSAARDRRRRAPPVTMRPSISSKGTSAMQRLPLMRGLAMACAALSALARAGLMRPSADDLEVEPKPPLTVAVLSSEQAHKEIRRGDRGLGRAGEPQVGRLCRHAVSTGYKLPFACPLPHLIARWNRSGSGSAGPSPLEP